jgi:hypothetical protein
MNVALREAIAKFERLEKHYEKPTFEVVLSVFREEENHQRGHFPEASPSCVLQRLSLTDTLYFAAEMGIQVSRQT